MAEVDLAGLDIDAGELVAGVVGDVQLSRHRATDDGPCERAAGLLLVVM